MEQRIGNMKFMQSTYEVRREVMFLQVFYRSNNSSQKSFPGGTEVSGRRVFQRVPLVLLLILSCPAGGGGTHPG